MSDDEKIQWDFYYRDKFAKKVINLINLNNADYNNRIDITTNDIPKDYQWQFQQNNLTFNKDLKLKNQYCHHPFNSITVDGNGDVFMCICQAWLPVSVGKIWDFNSLEEIPKSARAREIQSSILDGSYKYCNHLSCSILKEESLDQRIDNRPDNINWVNLALDYSCNLSCPSCRSEFKFINDEGLDYDIRLSAAFHLAKLIENHNYPIKFSLANDGDPFASNIYLNFLNLLDLQKKNVEDVEIELITNGILLQDHWEKINKIHNNIVRVKISVDAGTENVYNITRRRGSWNKLINNIKFISQWKNKNNSKMILTSNFVVQTVNYKDMIKYVDICNQLGFDEINFQKIDNWGTFDNFKEHAIWLDSHPLHQDFLKYINDPKILDAPNVNLTNLSHFKNATK